MATLLTRAADVKAVVVKKFNKGWDEYPLPGGRGSQIRFGFDEAVKEDCGYIHRLRSDLANSYYWCGDITRDYLFFIANWHPFLGMFCCHPNHPWSKRQRVEMFMISLALTMMPSALVAASLHHGCFKNAEVIAILLLVTIPDSIIGTLLYQLSIAHTNCPGCTPLLNCIMFCCQRSVLMSGLLSTGVCYLILRSTDVHWTALLSPLILGKLWSYITWFPIWFLMPCYMGFLHVWCVERNAVRQGLEPASARPPQEGNEQETLL